MPAVDVYNLKREKTGSIELASDIFDVEVREHLFHAAVTAQLSSRRSGTASTKERNAIRGTGAKPYRQKGTGRARQGSRKSPHYVGGGVVFGPSPRDFTQKLNKKTRRAALCAALSRRQQEGRLVVLEDFALGAPKTKAVAEVLGRFEASKALIVDTENEALARGARNLAKSNYLNAAGLNVYDVLKHDTVFLTRSGVEAIERRLGK